METERETTPEQDEADVAEPQPEPEPESEDASSEPGTESEQVG